jgi:hypothetical protein
MIHNYNANLDTRENRELLNKIFQIQLIKDKFYVPNDIQPSIFRHDLLFGQTKEGEGSSNNMRQFTLPVEGIGAIYSGNYSGGGSSGGALVSNGRLASHEAIYLEDENERGHAKRQTPFLGKRGEHSLANGLVGRGAPEDNLRRMFGVTPSMRGKGIKKFAKNTGHGMAIEGVKTGSGAFRAIIPKAKKGGSVAIKSAIKQNAKEKIKALPMKKLTGQFSILNKVI